MPPAAKESSGHPPFGRCWIGSDWIGVGGAALSCVGALLSSLDSIGSRFCVASESDQSEKTNQKAEFSFFLFTNENGPFFLDIYINRE
jgi:hypothetical protein